MPMDGFRRAFERTGRASVTSDVSDELSFHINRRVDELVARGMSPTEARAEAMRAFGDVETVRHELERLTRARHGRDRRGEWVADLGRDMCVSLRSLRRDPVFTSLALLTLAVGIGATTAIFTVVNAVVLRPLPYPAPERLVALWQVTSRSDRASVSVPNFDDWRTQTRSFEAMATYQGGTTTILGGHEPTRANVYRVSADFFRVLAFPPSIGRVFLPEDSRKGAAPVAVVNTSFWRRVLAERPIGQTRIELSGGVFDVIGVMPDEASFPERAEVWVPRELFDGAEARDGLNESVVARLAPGVSHERAQQELSAVAARLGREYPNSNPAFDARVIDLHRDIVGKVRDYLQILLGAVVLVLLVAAVNLASASLARGTARSREMAIRLALGSGRGRLVRQLLSESTLLAVAGGVAGVGLAWWLVRVLVRLAPSSIPRPTAIGLDGTVLAFAIAISVVTGLLVGLAPALFSSDVSPAATLSGGRGTVGDSRNRLRRLLVGAEVALALVLLAGGGLLLRSFATLVGEQPGFDARGALLADLNLIPSRYADGTARRLFYDGLLDRLRALPGVQVVALTSTPPLSWGPNGSILAEGRPDEPGQAHYHVVSGDYFRSLGVPLLRGRSFTAADDSAAPHVAVVNETFARQMWPAGDAVGKRVRFRGMDAHNEKWLTVIGVARDAKQIALDQAPVPQVYVSYRQRPERAAAVSIVVRSPAPPPQLASAVRDVVHDQGKEVPVAIATMEERVARSVADRRFVMVVLTAFGVIALLLAAVGIYGVLSYSVARRTREIGVRVALGAGTGTVLRMIVSDAMRPVLWGTALGVVGMLGLSRLLRGFVYGVGVTDPLTFVAATTVLIIVALLASWIPATRASRVDPIVALRSD